MAKRKLTPADTLYVETYRNTKSPEEIARDLEISVLSVQKMIDVAVATELESLPKKPPTLTQIAFKQNKQEIGLFGESAKNYAKRVEDASHFAADEFIMQKRMEEQTTTHSTDKQVSYIMLPIPL